MPKLLIVGENRKTPYGLARHLRAGPLRVTTVGTAGEGIAHARRCRPDVVLLYTRLPDMPLAEALGQLLRARPGLPVIVLSGYATPAAAIEAMKQHAFDYLSLPVDLGQLRRVLVRAVAAKDPARARAVAEALEAGGSAEPLVGRCAAMQEVYKAVGLVAPRDTTVLLLGETGTGKEVVARLLHDSSPRRRGPFLAVNCPAMPESLLESELFGHEKGAFTGAERERAGRFEEADGGTLFLDEVGDLPSAAQAKLLRVLQEQRFTRLGGGRVLHTDARIVAATNRDLAGLVTAGSFRQDLYHRLKGFAIALPALRDRGGDLADLVEHFREEFNRQLGKQVTEVAAETMRALCAYPWPGNVRELRGVMEYALLHAEGEVLTPDCLPPEVRRPAAPAAARPPVPATGYDLVAVVRGLIASGRDGIYKALGDEMDQVVLTEVLRHTGGHMGKAARILGLAPLTLRQKLRGLGLTVHRGLAPGSGAGSQNLALPAPSSGAAEASTANAAPPPPVPEGQRLSR